MSLHHRIVFPLDVTDLRAAESWVQRLVGEVGVFKVGLALFCRFGPDAVRMVKAHGARCFLDLKLHDIPKTTAEAAAGAAELGVDYLTLHASAGQRALAESARAVGVATQLLAVTALTSLSAADLRSIGMAGSPEDTVVRLAQLADSAGIRGLVCSPLEAAALRALGSQALLVVPGIREADADADDQSRTATPGAAIANGADLLVVGRPIRNDPDPVRAARRIAAAIERAASEHTP